MLERALIEQLARSVGFDDCGVARAVRLEQDAQYLAQWTAKGCHGSMAYLERNQDLRADIRLLVPSAQTVVAVLLNYYTTASQPLSAPYVALSGRPINDYHLVVKAKLKALLYALQAQTGHNLTLTDASGKLLQQAFCDSAPLFERRYAVQAGLGWIGKNHMLLHPTLGSFCFIGILALPEACDSYAEPMASLCPSHCTLCQKACPTGALRSENWEARQCLSYLTIERKEPLPAALEGLAKQHFYGCDTCQKVCPFNHALKAHTHPELAPNPAFETLTQADYTALSQRQKLKLVHRLAKNEN